MMQYLYLCYLLFIEVFASVRLFIRDAYLFYFSSYSDLYSPDAIITSSLSIFIIYCKFIFSSFDCYHPINSH